MINRNLKNNIISKILSLILTTILTINTSCNQPLNNLIYINQVIDGDTFVDQENNYYRLLGVDTPESFDNDNYFKPTIGIQQFYANQAKIHSTKLIMNKNVVMHKWKLDFYKRMVTRIKYKNFDLAKTLLASGLARVKYISPEKQNYFYYPDVSYYEELIEIEKYAKIHKIGIWKLAILEQKLVFPK